MTRLIFTSIIVSVLMLSSVTVASSWTGPTTSAPGANVAAPFNVGTASQVKNGVIGVNGISVFGNSLLYGSGSGGNAYLNFGTTAGSAGYGIYDNGGTLDFKNSGGSWQSLQSIVSGLVGSGGSQWTTSGSNIYYNTGNVGIGTLSPEGPLDVSGRASATSFKVSSTFSDLVNNAPWYGIGESNYVIPWASSPAVQVAGYNGILFQTASGQVSINLAGNMAIGNVTAYDKLDVAGTVGATDFYDETSGVLLSSVHPLSTSLGASYYWGNHSSCMTTGAALGSISVGWAETLGCSGGTCGFTSYGSYCRDILY